MDKKTKKAFEAVVKGLGLTDSDICQWLINKDAFLVPTDLPIVYADGKELTIKQGLDIKLKDKVWGIQLSSGIILAGDLIKRTENQLLSGKEIMELAKSYTLNGKSGGVPLSWRFEKLKISKEWLLFQKTIHTLNDYCDSCLDFDWGVVWTSTNHFNTSYLCFDLQKVNELKDWGVGYINNWYSYEKKFEDARLALFF